MFLRRQWQELLVEFRTWLQTHVLNERIQIFLGADSLKDITEIEQIPQFALLLDQDIWDDDKPNVIGENSSLNLMTTDLAKLTQLHTLYKNFEKEFLELGGQIYQTFFDRIFYVAGKELADSELDEIVNDFVSDPWDVGFMPISDVTNYNGLILIHVANLKRKANLETLARFTLK